VAATVTTIKNSSLVSRQFRTKKKDEEYVQNIDKNVYAKSQSVGVTIDGDIPGGQKSLGSGQCLG